MSRIALSALALAAAVALLLALVWALQRRMIYFPSQDVPAPAAIGLSGAEEIRYRTRDGLEVRGWFVGAGDGRRDTVLVFNGNAGNRAHRAPLADALRTRGFNVLLTDYRGYGGNPGAPSESGLAEDSRAARQYLLGRSDVDPARLVYFGESLGAAVAVELAAEHAPAALVLRSPFTSLADVGAHHYSVLPVRLLLRDRFDATARVPGIRVPILVIAGDRDSIVPFAQSQQIYEAAAGPKAFVVIRAADHNDIELLSGTEMIEAIATFLASR